MPILAENKKARFDYDILETYEAGLVLTGPEVKAVKQGQLNLKGSYVSFHGDNATIINMHISLYKPAGRQPEYDPTHSRRLLLRSKEIGYLRGKSYEHGLTIIPLKVYTKGRLVKVEIGVGRGRKKYDKREVLRKREAEREMKKVRKGLNI